MGWVNYSYPMIARLAQSGMHNISSLWGWGSAHLDQNACMGVAIAAALCMAACLGAFCLGCVVVIVSLCSSTALGAFGCALVASCFIIGCAMACFCMLVCMCSGAGAVVLALSGIGMYAWVYLQASGGVFARVSSCVKGPAMSAASLACTCVRFSLGLARACAWKVRDLFSVVGWCTGVCVRVCVPSRVYSSV